MASWMERKKMMTETNPIFKRTSVRQWTNEPVSDEQILKIGRAHV